MRLTTVASVWSFASLAATGSAATVDPNPIRLNNLAISIPPGETIRVYIAAPPPDSKLGPPVDEYAILKGNNHKLPPPENHKDGKNDKKPNLPNLLEPHNLKEPPHLPGPKDLGRPNDRDRPGKELPRPGNLPGLGKELPRPQNLPGTPKELPRPQNQHPPNNNNPKQHNPPNVIPNLPKNEPKPKTTKNGRQATARARQKEARKKE